MPLQLHATPQGFSPNLQVEILKHILLHHGDSQFNLAHTLVTRHQPEADQLDHFEDAFRTAVNELYSNTYLGTHFKAGEECYHLQSKALDALRHVNTLLLRHPKPTAIKNFIRAYHYCTSYYARHCAHLTVEHSDSLTQDHYGFVAFLPMPYLNVNGHGTNHASFEVLIPAVTVIEDLNAHHRNFPWFEKKLGRK